VQFGEKRLGRGREDLAVEGLERCDGSH
jgi:hypothetical protein